MKMSKWLGTLAFFSTFKFEPIKLNQLNLCWFCSAGSGSGSAFQICMRIRIQPTKIDVNPDPKRRCLYIFPGKILRS